MKFTKKFAMAAVAGLALLSATACSNNSGSNSSSSSDKIPAKINKKTTVVFWHGMAGVQESTLKELTKEFEKKNPNVTIKLQNQGAYKDLQAKINSTLQSPKNLPTITQAYPNWLMNAANNKMLVDLKPYFNDKNVGWGGADKSGIKSDLLKTAQIGGTQYGVPFNKSIEVLVYNKDMFKKYGVKVPSTMAELKTAAKKIWTKSNHKVVGAGFDSLSNYYMLGMKNEGINFNSKINFASKTSTKVINYYADGIKAGYFRTAGSEHFLSGPFANQKVAMFIGTSAGEGFVKKGVGNSFDYEVAKRPGKYTVSQGTDIYMFSKASALEKAAAFKYMKFLVSKNAQIKWANATGYLPVSAAAANSSEFKNSKSTKLAAKLNETMKNMYAVPVLKNSNATYSELSNILETIFASAAKKQDIKSQIEAGKAKFDAAWKQ